MKDHFTVANLLALEKVGGVLTNATKETFDRISAKNNANDQEFSELMNVWGNFVEAKEKLESFIAQHDKKFVVAAVKDSDEIS